MNRTTHTNTLRLYLPTNNPALVLEYWVRRLACLAGGCTVTQGLGHWVSPSGELVSEPVSILEALEASTESLESEAPRFADYCLSRGERAVLTSWNGTSSLWTRD